VTIRYRDRKWQSSIVGASENYFTSFSWAFQAGAPFNRQDDENAEAVCVLGSKIYEELFKGESAVGKSILIGQLPAKVIGILEEKGGGMGGPHVDDRAIMPLTTVRGRLTKEKRYLSAMRIKTDRNVDETIEDIKIVLRRNHLIQGQQSDDFTVRGSKEVLQFLSVISGSLFLFLGTASIVALVVSGFVLANLFYLTIEERRKDIGIRRAYGATRKGILLAFLCESVFITLLGGVAGIILSLLLGGTFEKLFNIPMKFSLKVVIFAMIFSFLTGLLSGLKPAIRASRIEPIEAIRG
jgi:putative ABC transport system permease protein